MIATRNATPKQRRSSRARNDYRPFGYQPTILAKWRHERLAKDVKAGLFPKSVLATRFVKLTMSGKENRGSRR